MSWSPQMPGIAALNLNRKLNPIRRGFKIKIKPPRNSLPAAFTLPELLTLLAGLSLLVCIIASLTANVRTKRDLNQCRSNLQQVGRAVLMYADDNHKILPEKRQTPLTGIWWWYKEEVKRYAGLSGKSSPDDKVFACPRDRGYEDEEGGKPFCQNARFDFGSYPFNGVNLPGIPHLSGREMNTIRDPRRTLLVMEWTAHAPLSWHKSKTGKRNLPFYNDAQSVVGFVDGHVSLTRIYYDGMNAAYTRDPIAGYDYKYSGD